MEKESPLHQFTIEPLLSFKLGGVDLSFNNSALFMVVAAVLISILMVSAAVKSRLIPGRWQAVAEMLHGFVYDMVRDNAGPQAGKWFPFVFALFSFILAGNLIGMIPFTFTFTSHIIVTFALAMTVFFAVTIYGFVKHGFHFFGAFFPPGAPVLLAPLIIPIEVLSYLSRPVSLSIRLFANMMAGHTMLKVFGGFAVLLGIWGVAPLAMIFALTGFEILVAVLQAYVFSVLTCIYIRNAIELH
ncbi:MAG: F0F1 ATP synthase subunit A [Candidatus Pacebacteria bacterium]|nr:F0F1 ATP synthase subunit A [Candidatus Paceibacterota bacterium]